MIPASEFILGRNKTIRQQDELLLEILVPQKGLENYYFKKIGGRKALTRARVSFAEILEIADTEDNKEDSRIVKCSTAFGAVSDTIIQRKDIDEMLIGKTVQEARAAKDAYLAAYDQAIIPVKGRISAEYRKDVCMNLLGDFLDQNGI